MRIRKIATAAAIFASLALVPDGVSAQDQGLDRAEAARAQAVAVANGEHQLGGPVITELPPGIAQVFAGRELPPGLARRYQPVPTDNGDGGDTGTSGDDPVCLAWETVVSGFTVTEQCVLWG